jgi:hypothetical protein
VEGNFGREAGDEVSILGLDFGLDVILALSYC